MQRHKVVGILLIMPLILSILIAMYLMPIARIIFGGVFIVLSFVVGVLLLLFGEE